MDETPICMFSSSAASLASWSALSFPGCPTCSLIQVVSNLYTLPPILFRLLIISFTSSDVSVLLLSACVAACVSETIFMYLSCSVRFYSSSFIANFIAIISAWKTVASLGSHSEPSFSTLAPFIIV